jgi:hypothetical protein
MQKSCADEDCRGRPILPARAFALKGSRIQLPGPDVEGNITADHRMHKLASVSGAAAIVLLAGAARAMPPAPVQFAQGRLTIPVADGCGFNRYRDAQGVCRRKYVLSRHHGKTPFYGACGGVNSHRVCNLYGQCWMVCN